MKRFLGAFGVVLLISGSATLGHEGATGIVMQRMDEMEHMKRSMKRIDERVKGKSGSADIAREADAVGAAAARIPELFPRGSGGGHSEAKASVWEKWPEFVAASRELREEAEKLAGAARSRSETAVLSQFRSVARACSGCHDLFKAK